jgi:hypothetical protein
MKYAYLYTIRWSLLSIVKHTKCEINDFSIVFSAKTVSSTSFTFLSVMRRFLVSNSLAILSLIAIKNSQRESREGQGARAHQSSFCPAARGWLSLALELDNLNISEMFLGHWHVRAFDTYFSCCFFLLSLNVFHSSFFKISIERISYGSPVITLASWKACR